MDWNNDGKNDLISGDTRGQVWLFLNEGTKKNPKLAAGKLVEAAGKPIRGKQTTYKTVNKKRVVDKVVPANHELAQTYSWLHIGDWNGDDLDDILIGHSSTITFYKNVGTPSEPRFADPTLIELPKSKRVSRPAPFIIDWDGDGTKDLLVGCEKLPILFFANVGTNQEPKLAEGKEVKLTGDGFSSGYRYRFDVVDWNEDGKRDLLVGNAYAKMTGGTRKTHGNVWLFLGK